MAVTIERFQVRPYAFPLAVSTARGLMAERRGWHVGLFAEGLCGWGDVAPWPGFGADAGAVAAALVELDLLGRGLDGPMRAGLPAPVAHGVEQALLDLRSRIAGRLFATILGLEPAAAVATHRLVRSPSEARAAVDDGAPALKIKVGADPLADDDARVGAIRDAAPDTPLRLDANGAWDRATAAEAMRALGRHRPAWIEQPLAADDLAGLAALRGPVPIALDESVALYGARALAVADVAVIKPMFVGGLRRARDLALAARALGCAVCITHALESPIGRLGALHLAAGLEGPEGRGIHGLAGSGLLAPVGRVVPVPSGPGLGADPEGWS